MEAFVLTLHVIACVLLIGLVLLQSGKEGMGVIFGGGSSSVFGSSGAGGLLVKLTAALATLFLITSLTYNVLTSVPKASTESVMDGTVVEEVEKKAPAVQIEEPEQTPAPAQEEKKQ